MIKTKEKKHLAARVLGEVSAHFWSKGMSICELSRCTGINRRTLARYLLPGVDIDLPIVALRLICDALDLPLDDVIPFPAAIDSDNKYDFRPVSANHSANLKVLNDIYIDRLRPIIKARYPSGTYYHLSEATNDCITEAGLRNLFRKKSDGHYPLMTLSAAVTIADAVQIYPYIIFN